MAKSASGAFAQGHDYDVMADGDEIFMSSVGGEGGRTELVDRFDEAVGILEDIIVDESFSALQSEFFRKHCGIFEDKEENKLACMDVFREYNRIFEGHVTAELVRRIPDFDKEVFAETLRSRKDEVCGDVFEILESFEDFMLFKEIMLAEKFGMDCEAVGDLSVETEGSGIGNMCGFGITVTPLGFPQ